LEIDVLYKDGDFYQEQCLAGKLKAKAKEPVCQA